MDVAGNGAPGKQRRLLEYEAERLLRRAVRVVGRLWPIDHPGRWRCEPGDQFEQRRFSAARGAQQADELARPDVEIDAGQGGRAVGKRLRNAAEAEQRPRRRALDRRRLRYGFERDCDRHLITHSACGTKLRILPGLSSPMGPTWCLTQN